MIRKIEKQPHKIRQNPHRLLYISTSKWQAHRMKKIKLKSKYATKATDLHM